MSTVLLLLL